MRSRLIALAGRRDQFQPLLLVSCRDLKGLRIAKTERSIGSCFMLHIGATIAPPLNAPLNARSFVWTEWKLLVDGADWHLTDNGKTVSHEDEGTAISDGLRALENLQILDACVSNEGVFVFQFENSARLHVAPPAIENEDIWMLFRVGRWSVSIVKNDKFELEVYD
jgi:hypothetical protein